MSLEGSDRVIDKEYLASLENKLKALKDSKGTSSKQFLRDIATYKDHQQYNLITSTATDRGLQRFDDHFSDIAVTVNYLKRLVAPQTCAINKQELLHLTRHDYVEKFHETAAPSEYDQESKSKSCDNTDIEVYFSEQHFLPFTEANHLFIIRKDPQLRFPIHTCLINTYGRLQFVEENKIVCLLDLLGESSLQNCHFVELACADMYMENSEECLAILATIWVELNEHSCPCRHFGALFVISPTLRVQMTDKLDGLAAVAHCSLTHRFINTEKCRFWILYQVGECPSIYSIDQFKAASSDDLYNALSELVVNQLPGTVIRSASLLSEELHWSALGLDTGHVFLSVFSKGNQAVYRKMIKFSGPISVVMFLQHFSSYTQNEEIDSYRDEQCLVVSSTLGPIAANILRWNNDFFLSQSEQFDTITAASIVDNTIAAGTYSGKLLFYSSNCDIGNHEIISMVKLHAPIVSVKTVDENTLYVLSTAGLHTVKRSEIGQV
ncbi:hypothetical protein DICVIV_13293 [Dictyocaulus viviparus]|uniref:Uncharacterized protein n=1 Tax=Dictyocaulus viviparus TaxID=29172 RepID=A0A0D8XAH5_DICVI|nr:hypothetical protein DICVIV_13293 [Dictyocaulus viviparus]